MAEAGRVRLFVSSPGDVQAERDRLAAVAARLQGRLGGLVTLETVLWEERFYTAERSFQGHLPRTAGFDLVVCILWGRIGTALPPSFPERLRPDGTAYESGTVYEVETALLAARQQGVPDLYVFRKLPAPLVRQDDPEKPAKDAQFALLEAFWRKWFRDEKGHFLASFQNFESTDAFEQQIETCLLQWLEQKGHLPSGVSWDVRLRGSPFRGLEPFGAEHAEVFFGRRRQRDDAMRELAAAAGRGCPSLLVVGNSGLGKSSFLAASLAPRLLEPGIVPGVVAWRVLPWRPRAGGADALLGLATALFAPDVLPELREGECRTPQALAERLIHATAPHTPQ